MIDECVRAMFGDVVACNVHARHTEISRAHFDSENFGQNGHRDAIIFTATDAQHFKVYFNIFFN